MSKALVLAKIEGTYGVDASPAKASDAILITTPKFSVLGRSLEREVVMATFGQLGRVNVGEGLGMTIGVELAGSGTATVAPRIGPLLQAMSFTETAGTANVVYAPNSDVDTKGCTIYFYYNDRLHKLVGCVGESLKISAKAGEYARAEFTMRGLYAGTHASDATTPTDPTYLQAAPPVFKSAGLTVGTYSPVLSSLDLEVTNTVGASRDANAAGGVTRYRVTQRKVTGTVVVEAKALSAWNPWTIWDAATAAAIAGTIGTAAGNRIVISIPNAQPADPPEYTETDGVVFYSYKFAPSVTLTQGNNELTLTFS